MLESNASFVICFPVQDAVQLKCREVTWISLKLMIRDSISKNHCWRLHSSVGKLLSWLNSVVDYQLLGVAKADLLKLGTCWCSEWILHCHSQDLSILESNEASRASVLWAHPSTPVANWPEMSISKALSGDIMGMLPSAPSPGLVSLYLIRYFWATLK